MSSIQFTIPTRVADELDFPTLRRHAIMANVPRTTIGYGTRSAPIGETRLTCSIEMVVFLIEALRALTAHAEKRGDLELALACAQAVKSAFNATAADRAKPDESPAARPAG
jgi:hypothetical protein